MNSKVIKMHALVEKIATLPFMHILCRSTQTDTLFYNFGKTEEKIVRPKIPDDKIKWEVKWDEYKKICIPYTSHRVLAEPTWADPVKPNDNTKWNSIDGGVDRRSFHGTHEILNGLPLNPVGRTGICERGLLGRWGPNKAVDPIVTRWKRDQNGQIIKNIYSDKYVLQVVLVKRRDINQWALPGGMIDMNETPAAALKREFMEEALNIRGVVQDQYEQIANFFENNGVEVIIYKGYNDDPRNTDNAWIETYVCHFHDEDGSIFENTILEPGNDELSAKWVDVDEKSLNLVGDHKEFIKKAAKRLNAHWL